VNYRATVHDHDLHRAQSLLREEGWPWAQWHWPVVVAEEGRHIRGAIGTTLEAGLVIMGPMALDRRLGKRAPFVAYRMGRFYDMLMGGIGMKEYYMRIEPELSQFIYLMDRLGFDRVAVEGDPGQWFKRRVGPWGQRRRSTHAQPVDGLAQRVRWRIMGGA